MIVRTYNMKVTWDKLLNSDTGMELKTVGQRIADARKQRKMSVVELASRTGVDRRTVTELERGNPKVAVGIFFQVLSTLNLLRGIEEVVRPENDIEAISNSIRKIRSRQAVVKRIDDKKVDF